LMILYRLVMIQIPCRDFLKVLNYSKMHVNQKYLLLKSLKLCWTVLTVISLRKNWRKW
jgi:hypothetical protein